MKLNFQSLRKRKILPCKIFETNSVYHENFHMDSQNYLRYIYAIKIISPSEILSIEHIV